MRIIIPETEEMWNDYLACRFRNLYEPFGLPHSVTTSELDHPRDRPGILHRAVVLDDDRIVAVGRLDLQPDHPAGPSAQLRYFAADTAIRGKGVSQVLMHGLEELAVANGARRLWMEARTTAVNFYQRLGYHDFGLGPNKHGLIPHRLLERYLDSMDSIPR